MNKIYDAFFYTIRERKCEKWENKIVQKLIQCCDTEIGSRSAVILSKYKDGDAIFTPNVQIQRNRGILR
jgi:hypothetical protein